MLQPAIVITNEMLNNLTDQSKMQIETAIIVKILEQVLSNQVEIMKALIELQDA